MKNPLKSQKFLGALCGSIASFLTAFLIDDPELAKQLAMGIMGLFGLQVAGQGAADSFGTEAYHSKK